MNWKHWITELRQVPQHAVANLLRGAANISPFERVAPHEFLMAVLPRSCRSSPRKLLGEPTSELNDAEYSDLPKYLDIGLATWLLDQRQAQLPPTRKLSAFAAQVCEALQWPLYFSLPQTREALLSNRAQWIKWLGALSLSAYRDPEYDYWQTLASQQTDDQFQFFWHSFVLEAGRTRSLRYLNLGLLALAKMPLSEDDSLRNLRLQVQALVGRYQLRKALGTVALEELAQALRGVMVRNPSLSTPHYQAFLTTLFLPLGDDKKESLLSLLGLVKTPSSAMQVSSKFNSYKLQPPGKAAETDQAIWAVSNSRSLAHAWQVIRPLLSAHEDFLRKSGDAYYFLRNLDRCVRALCKKYTLQDPEIQTRLYQWIHLALRIEPDDAVRWMLWELVLRKAGQPERAKWVLWEMTRRFPDDISCRVELARLLSDSNHFDDQAHALRLLQQALELDPSHLHAHSTLAQLAIRRNDWPSALNHAQQGLRIDPADGHSAVLLASAYARQNTSENLQFAIDGLRRFVTNNSGNLKAEDYLNALLRRQKTGVIRESSFENNEIANSENLSPETAPAWREFGESIQLWLASSLNADTPQLRAEDDFSVDRVLPLPQALLVSIGEGNWDADVLSQYDSSIQHEFPLETRLYRYLRTLRSTSVIASERDHAKDTLRKWLETEAQVAKQDDTTWVSYLYKRMKALDAPVEIALAVGTDWLKNLLDQYRSLPAPLFE